MDQRHLNKLLFMAICQHNLKNVQNILQMGANINSYELFPLRYCSSYLLPIEYAIHLYLTFIERETNDEENKIFEIIEFLVKNGAILNFKCNFYRNEENNLTILQFLSVRDYVLMNFGSIELTEKVLDKRTKNIFKLFLKNGADINSKFIIWDYSSDETSILEMFCHERLNIFTSRETELDKIIKLLILNGSNFCKYSKNKVCFCNIDWINFFEQWPQLILYFCCQKKNIKIHYCLFLEEEERTLLYFPNKLKN